jgi:flagellar biosynthesis protein FliR
VTGYLDNLPAFLLIVSRVSGIFMGAPVIGSRNLQPHARVGAALGIAFIIAPFVPIEAGRIATDIVPFAGLAVKELAIGVMMGIVANFMFNAVQLAGQILDVQIGFGIANVVDPMTSAQVPVMGQFQFILATLLFLALDGHHLLLLALQQSFDLVPLTRFWFTPELATKFTDAAGEMWSMAIKVGAPAVGALFLAEVALGMVARTVPQMNVFIVGIPMKIALGFVIVLAAMPFFGTLVAHSFNGMYRDLVELARAMGAHA